MKNGTTKEGKREGRYKKEKEMLRGFLIFKAILKRYDDVFCCFGGFVYQNQYNVLYGLILIFWSDN